ncbi:MAG TPA: efflux RND transporter periplasmic adaptor subunit [Pseudolabrys sp.]|nr:efflux RND transporter periplasmic adaptor subunit [Pseudolabrys sp.]
MSKRKWLLGAAAIAIVGVALLTRGFWGGGGAVAQAPAERTVAVEVSPAVKKMVPLTVDALGTVTPITSVAIKARLETEIVGVHFADGARVKKGDLLFTLDSRQVLAQIAQAEGVVARDRAQLEGAERDISRYTDLVAKSATPVVNLDNAKTQADIFRAAIKADTALLDNLKIQLGYCEIRAPIDGRISAASVKVGNFVRPADIASLATINQIAPVYVSFTVSQDVLPNIRQAIAAETATVDAAVPGDNKHAAGQVTMIENSVDASTGMVMIRATMANKDEVLWPGTLVTTKLNIRDDEAVTVPSAAIQVSQAGTFVFVIKDGKAGVQKVDVERTVGTTTVLKAGLQGGESVVVDGHLQLRNGSRVNIRAPKAGT